jgi:DNA-directed RNA polymerase specialized sigma24 family protein
MVADEIALMLGRGDLSAQQEDELLACLERACSKLHQVRSHSPAGIRAWLQSILRNQRADQARWRHRQPPLLSLGELAQSGTEPSARSADPVRLTVHGEKRRRLGQLRAMLEELLDTLPPARAWLFRSRFFDQMPIADLADALQITPAAAVMRYQRVRDRVLRDLATALREDAPEIIEFFTGEPCTEPPPEADLEGLSPPRHGGSGPDAVRATTRRPRIAHPR